MGTLLIRAVSGTFRAVPRVKGLGILLNQVAKRLAADHEIEATVHGSRMILNPAIEYERNLLFVPQYHERAERRFIRRVLRPGDYVIDVGANIGVFTLFFRRLVGARGKITAIEPEPLNYRKLVRHAQIADAGSNVITTHNVGVAGEPGTFTLHLDPSNPGAHSMLPLDGSVKAVEISCVPLATLVDRKRRPRLLKIDIEGLEHPVLERYFADTPAELRPDYIMLEDWPDRRAGDSVALCLANGYERIERHGADVMLKRAPNARTRGTSPAPSEASPPKRAAADRL